MKLPDLFCKKTADRMEFNATGTKVSFYTTIKCIFGTKKKILVYSLPPEELK